MDAALAGDGDLDSYLAALSTADAESPTELTGRFGSAQVFQLRLPALRIEQLRRMAADRGVSPGALAVDWVIERLDREAAENNPATSPMPIAIDEPTRKRSLRRLGLR
jgi:aryl-alcohol dehydrogenase-like predicted oxidoreductase